MRHLVRTTLGPLFFIFGCPPAVFVLWYINFELAGSLTAFGQLVQSKGFFPLLYDIISPVFFGSETAWTILAVFAAVQLAFMKLLPGKTYLGPITPKGNVPIYKANGVPAFFLTMFLFITATFGLGLFPATIIYDHFGELLGALNLFSLFFCAFLLLKGLYAPSSSDNGSSGNLIFDYYWGTELYPRIAGWDVKMFTNCRFGLMSWGLILLSFAAKQYELNGFVSNSMIVGVALQLIYITKFFFWETGYLSSLDIMHDRAGFYICWGCLVWVPGFYTSATPYLVQNPVQLNPWVAAAIFIAGTTSIMVNYWADRQRQKARASQGNCLVWGKKPHLIPASYTTEQGEVKQSFLLASGWWGVARHFHYVPEILGAFFWSLPALFSSPLPYLYVIFLTALLAHRAFRDDERCAKKYGESWDEYSRHVPYYIVPYVI